MASSQDHADLNGHENMKEGFNKPGLDENEVVISGVSTVMPGCQNIIEFADKLYDKVNLVKCSSQRWNFKYPELPKYNGIIPDIDRFDPQFFCVFHELSQAMDAMTRKVMEQSYQAIFDAGICPTELSGRPIGVFVSTGICESEKTAFYGTSRVGITSANRAMAANRVSYYLNLKGPSLVIEDLEVGTAVALDKAYKAIRGGECEAAIVGGAKALLHPQTSLHYHRLVPACHDGKVKCYDVNADGHVLSEGVTVIFIQKYKDAKRVYASIKHIEVGFTGSSKDTEDLVYQFYREPSRLTKFYQEFYANANVSPSAVEYVEGCGAGVPKADRAELMVFDEVFCKHRTDPLLVGSVVSNIGFTEAVLCLSGIVKLVLAYHKGTIAANINLTTPHDVAADGRLQILTEHAKFGRTFTAINNFSITGSNVHVLLEGLYKPKDLTKYRTNNPYLVMISGRQESSVQRILDEIKSRPLDPEEIALFWNIHRMRISNHLARGFGIYSSNEQETVTIKEQMDYYDGSKKPLWFVYSGMGSQWTGMGTHLMQIPIFAAAIHKCAAVLKPKGVNLVDIITSTDKSVFENILNSFVGIAAVQIGLTDVLKAIGLFPDKIIGHSTGELGCAYADECHTAEEVIMMAYSRGLVSMQTPFILGSMAAIGMGNKQVSKLLPPEIVVACRNGPNSSTISGPADAVKEFIATLTAQGIFSKEVPCSNIAYHSKYIAEAGPALLELLQDIVTAPKLRSERWLSSSVPEDKWKEPAAQTSSAEYHTNNLLNPVLFEETLTHVPLNAVLVEIAPHGLLQAILRRSLPNSCKNIPLTKSGHDDGILFLLEAVGKLYMEGYDIDISPLYPKVEFPVSTETRHLSHLVEWYSTKMALCEYKNEQKKIRCIYNPTISVHDQEYQYLKGNVVNGMAVLPLAGVLKLVWDTFTMAHGHRREEVPVQFLNVTLHFEPFLSEHRSLDLTVTMQIGCGRFEVKSKQGVVADGFITVLETPLESSFTNEDEYLSMTKDDIYKIFWEKDYQQKNDFRSIVKANKFFTKAEIEWKQNWVTFIDGVLQLNILRQNSKHISQPLYVDRITIDINEQIKYTENNNQMKNLVAVVSENRDDTRCGGLLIENVIFKERPSFPRQTVALKELVKAQDARDGGYYLSLREENYTAKNAALSIGKFGDLNTLKWVEPSNLSNSGVIVNVHYAALNVNDARRAIGEIYNINKRFGMDFSGVTDRGIRVMGIIKEGAVCRKVQAQTNFLWPVPSQWTLEDAATVPLPYCLAFYCLIIKSDLTKGANVLIHGGAGALGQAAISICLAHDCNVFTTVSDIKKKNFLCKLFPNLPAAHIGNSRDVTFKDMIMKETKGKGCHYVLSTVTANLREISFGCCSISGVLIDTEQLSSQEKYVFGMDSLNKATSYTMVDFSSIFNNVEEMKILQLMLSEGISRGYVRPLTRLVYSPPDVSRAFRLLSGSKHRGRVLVDLRFAPATQPGINCSANTYHVIFNDDGDFGLQLADQLIQNGAKKLHINSKMSPYLDYKKLTWEKQGIQIGISLEKIHKKEQIIRLIKGCNRHAPVEAVYVIRTGVFNIKSIADTYNLVIYLDEVTRQLCPDLRYFAVIHDQEENLGQEVSINRARCGLPSLSLQLTNLEKFDDKYENNLNCNVLRQKNALDCLGRVLRSNRPVVMVHAQPLPVQSLFEEIATVTGITINNKMSEDGNLKDIGVDLNQAKMLSNLFEEKFNIRISKDSLLKLTIAELNQIQDINETKEEELSGIAAYFNFIDSDELLANASVVQMRTLLYPSELREDEFHHDLPHLCIVPGIEGHHRKFYNLCKRLKISALVLQPGFDNKHETIRHMAKHLVQIMTRKLIIGDHFYLLGYEFGVLVALEMAAIFEEKGLTGTVYCLGGTPEDIRSLFKSQFQNSQDIQNRLLKHIFPLLTNSSPGDFELELKITETWEDKVEIFMKQAHGRHPHSIEYVRALVNETYNRIIIACDSVYRTPTLRSKIVILKAKLPVLDQESSTEFPNVTMEHLKISLTSTPEDLSCPAVINKYLEPDVLEYFNDKNLCETEVINTSETFNVVDDLMEDTSIIKVRT